jgi:6-phosphogluconolactonase/glucosamine-6-phosphate isomerase/deaminase
MGANLYGADIEALRRLGEVLARHADTLEWSRIGFFLGDERFVPPDHEENN